MALTESQRRIKEGTTPKYTATIQDEDGAAIALADIAAITLTLYDVKSGTIINSRNAQDVLNTNGVTIHATSGLLTWIMSAADNAIVGTPRPGVAEKHIALFEWTYDTSKRGKHEVELDVVQLAKVT